jgi:hypothetical protein
VPATAGHGEHPSLQPDQPTQVKQPFHRPGWVYGEKIDGWRMFGYMFLDNALEGAGDRRIYRALKSIGNFDWGPAHEFLTEDEVRRLRAGEF